MITKSERTRQTVALKHAMLAVGIRQAQILKVMKGLKDAVAAQKPLRLKRVDWRRIEARLPRIGSKIVLVRTAADKVRAFSQEGHEALKANARKNRPWMKTKARLAAAAK